MPSVDVPESGADARFPHRNGVLPRTLAALRGYDAIVALIDHADRPRDRPLNSGRLWSFPVAAATTSVHKFVEPRTLVKALTDSDWDRVTC